MSRLVVLVAFVLTAAASQQRASAQWALGGSVHFDDALHPNLAARSTSKQMGMNDLLDDVRGFGEPIKQETSAGGREGEGNAPSDADPNVYYEQWMPTARPGFVIPQQFRRPLMEGGKPVGDDEDIDVDAVMNERARKAMPTKSPGSENTGVEKCLKQIARFCSLSVMSSDFAAFASCVYEMRYHVRQNCYEWCETHGRCAADMTARCPKMTPIETTECIITAKNDISEGCRDSPYFKSIEDGIVEMRESSKATAQGTQQENEAKRRRKGNRGRQQDSGGSEYADPEDAYAEEEKGEEKEQVDVMPDTFDDTTDDGANDEL